jgi:hypothetical protein
VKTTGFALAAAVLAAAALGPAGGATQVYTSGVTPLLDAAGGKTIGSVGPGVALTVEGQSGSATHVAIQGLAVAGTPATIYGSAVQKNVAVSGFSGHAVTGSAQKVGAATYVATTVDGWVATAATVADVQTVWKAAGALYQQKCGSCHDLPLPNTYAASQWPGVVKSQADNAGLLPNETALITAYLQAQSGH